MFWEEVTPEEEEAIIKKAAELISKYGMEPAAVLMLESIKPLAFVGSGLGRLFLAPFLSIIGRRGDVFLTTFEKNENIEKLTQMVEAKVKAEKEEKYNEETPKKGWRRLFPF